MKNLILFILTIIFAGNLTAQEITVCPTVNNFLYRGIENPVKIMAEGHDCNEISASVTGGKILKRNNCDYIIIPGNSNEVRVSVSGKKNSESKNLGSMYFRVKNIPDPTVLVNRKNSGHVSKDFILNSYGIEAQLDNFDYDVVFKVTSFELIIKHADEIVITKTYLGNQFPSELKSHISKAYKGDKVYFENIKAMGPDGIERQLPSIDFTIK